MMTDAVKCMADTRASPPLDSALTYDAFDVVGDGDDFFARFGVEGEIGSMGFHETVPPRAVQRSTWGWYHLLKDRRYTPPVEVVPFFTKRSFNLALMASHHG